MNRLDEGSSDAKWTAGTWAVLCLLVTLSSVSLIWLCFPYYDCYIDGAMYLLTARSILAGEGYTYLGEPFIIRPPGLSILLLPVLATVKTNFYALNLYVSAYGVLCIGLLFALIRPRLGNLVAFTVAVAVWLNPVFQQLCNQVMSDVPGAAALLACLLLERWARRRPSRRRDFVVAGSIAAAAYIRTFSLLVVPAIVLARLIARRKKPTAGAPRRWHGIGVLIVLPVLAVVPWFVRNTLSKPTAPAVQTWNYSYTSAMFRTDRGDPESPYISWSEFSRRTHEHMLLNLSALGARLEESDPDTPSTALGILGALALLLVFCRRREAPELLAILGLGFVATLHNNANRLVLPMFLIALPAMVEVLVLVVGSVVKSRIASVVSASLVLALAYHDFAPRRGWNELRQEHLSRLEVVSYLATLPGDGPLASRAGWEYGVLLERPVFSLRIALRRGGTRAGLDVLSKNRIAYAILSDVSPKGRALIAAVDEHHESIRVFEDLTIYDLRDLHDGGESPRGPDGENEIQGQGQATESNR